MTCGDNPSTVTSASAAEEVAESHQLENRTRSAKPEWDNSELAKFLRTLSIEKDREQKQQHQHYVGFGPRGFGSRNETGNPDTYVWRQRYLRSYTFTNEDEYLDRTKGVVAGVLKTVSGKVDRWVKRGNRGGLNDNFDRKEVGSGSSSSSVEEGGEPTG